MKKRVNYDFERRKKELDRQRKKDQKQQRKEESKARSDDAPVSPTVPSDGEPTAAES